jgi:uncharacterized protein
MKQIKIVAVAVLVTLLPTVATVTRPVHLQEQRFDGLRYRLGWEGVVAQQRENTCGLAVIANLLRWAGRDVTERALLEDIELDPRGLNLEGFARLATVHGLRGAWFRVDASSLEGLSAPFVAQLRLEQGHFVIVQRVYNGYVYVADPLRGNNLYPLERFRSVWTGRVFVREGA